MFGFLFVDLGWIFVVLEDDIYSKEGYRGIYGYKCMNYVKIVLFLGRY